METRQQLLGFFLCEEEFREPRSFVPLLILRILQILGDPTSRLDTVYAVNGGGFTYEEAVDFLVGERELF